MAENTETYKVVIDTSVEGADNVQLLNSVIKTSIGEFENLNEAIGKTQDTLGKVDPNTDEFKQLSKELQVLKDRLRETEAQSLRFTEALAAQPGVLGLVGQSLEGLRGTFKLFMANPIIAVLAGIAGAFLALKESLSRTEEGQAKLNKISENFTKILNGLFAILEPIAFFFADLIGSILENEKVLKGLSIATGVLTSAFQTLFGIGKGLVDIVINNLITGFTTLIEIGTAAGKVLKGVFTLDLGLIQEGLNGVKDAYVDGVKDVVNNVVGGAKNIANGVVDNIVDGFNAGADKFKEGVGRLTDVEKEAETKRIEEAKKREDERLKLIEEAGKLQTEAYLASLEERDREILLRETQLTDDLATLEAGRTAAIEQAIQSGNANIKTIEEEFNKSRLLIEEGAGKDIVAINDKYAALARDKRIAGLDTQFAEIVSKTNAGYDELIAIINEKETELLSNTQLTEDERKRIQLDAINERKGILEKQYSDEILGLDLQFELIINTNAEDYDELIRIVDEKEKILLANTQLTENERLAIQKDFAQQRADIRANELNDNLLALDTEANNLTTSFERRRDIITEQENIILQLEGATEAQRTAIRQQAAAQRAAIDNEELTARAEVQNAYLDLVGNFGAAMQGLAGENKKVAIAGVIVEQAAAIGKIVVNTAVANAKAVAALPLTGGLPFTAINTISAGLGIASSIAAGAKAIQQINSSSSGGTASGGGGLPSASGGGASGIATPSVQGVGVPQITGTEGGNNPTAQIASTLAQRTDKPIKAYVVSGDVTSQQALDRRTNRAATFGG